MLESKEDEPVASNDHLEDRLNLIMNELHLNLEVCFIEQFFLGEEMESMRMDLLFWL